MSLRFTYTLTPRTRVSAGRAGSVLNTREIHTVIPGTAVRGALGTAWWSHPTAAFDGHDAERIFDRLFGRQLVVGPAVPFVGDRHAELCGLSEVSCKYPGSECPPGRHDLVARRLDVCPMCGGAIERSRGGWDVDGSWLVDTTRTALKNGAAVDEQLFTRKAMGRQVCYRGRLTVRGADEDELAAELAWLQQRFDISIGGQRSTLGRCGWSLEPAVAPPLPEGNTIVFRLRSPAILIGAFGQPTFDLKGYLGARAGAGDVGATWTRPEQVSGWHGVAGVPKPLEWALATGSTALLSGWARSSLQEVRQGVGLRQREGFGEVELFAVGDLRTWDLASESGEKPGGQKHRSQDRSIASVAPARVSSEAHADPVEELSGLLPAELRVKTLKALRGACRQLMLTVDNGLPAATCIADALNQPWARDLGPDSRNLVARTLKDPDIGDHVARLDTLIGEPG